MADFSWHKIAHIADNKVTKPFEFWNPKKERELFDLCLDSPASIPIATTPFCEF
jgi:hypothetical protein